MAKRSHTHPALFRLRGAVTRGLTYFLLIVGALIMVAPFLWMISTSVMTLGEANAGRLFPRSVRFSCPYVNLPSLSDNTVTGFSVSPAILAGQQELHTDSYYVEVRDEGGWQFRLVNNKGTPIAIAPVGRAGQALTEEWQPIPAGGGTVDTGLGMSFSFSPPGAYAAAVRRKGAARVDYVNCCEYPTDMQNLAAAQRADRVYAGRDIPADLTNRVSSQADAGS